MRYGDEDRESNNVEDRRGQRGPFGFPGFPGGGDGTRIQIPIGGGGISLTTLVIIGVIMLFLGINPLDLLSEAQFPDVPQMPQSDATGAQSSVQSRSGDPRPARRHQRAHRRTT